MDHLLVKSPFYIVEGKSKWIELWYKTIHQICSYNEQDRDEAVQRSKNTVYRYNEIKLLKFNSMSNKFNYTGENQFCNQAFTMNTTMDEILVIDYKRSSIFLRLQTCLH